MDDHKVERILLFSGGVGCLVYVGILLLVFGELIPSFKSHSIWEEPFNLLFAHDFVYENLGVKFANFLLTAKLVGLSILVIVSVITIHISSKYNYDQKMVKEKNEKYKYTSIFLVILIFVSQEPLGLCFSRPRAGVCGEGVKLIRFLVPITFIGILIWAAPGMTLIGLADTNQKRK